MEISFNFSNPKIEEKFPAHGWSKNSQGARCLWLPISRLILSASDIRREKGLTPLTLPQVREMRLFSANLKLLVYALKELHGHINLISIPPMKLSESQHFQESMDAMFTLPLRVDLVFYYLRRLADYFALSSRFVLYGKPGSAPWKFAELKNHTKDLLCDKDAFLNILDHYTSWFDKLRNNENLEVTGIRDVLAHRAGTVEIHHSQNGDGPWQLNVNLGIPAGIDNNAGDLITAIREIITELCIFWTEIHKILSKSEGYQKWIGPSPWGDCFLISGKDEDICGF